MKVLVVGGTGMIGGHAALYLQSKGHEVTIAGRRRLESILVLAALPFLKGNYLSDDITPDQLAEFEAVVFTAGADGRHVPAGEDADKYLLRANGVALPAFAELARSAGVKHFVHIGSAYPHILPGLVEENPYIRSRKLAADGVAKLSTPTFSACSLDPPFVVGTVPGMKVPMFEAYVQYAEGKFGLPESAPVGGLNFISAQSLSEAIEGALENGPAVAGRTILIGDENFTYATYFEKFFRTVRKIDVNIQARDEEHPMLPRSALFAGDRVISYEPGPRDIKILGNYRRKDVNNAVEEIVKQYHVAG
ncbi:hypothetical protein B0J13DRAFT_517226 [Dactylonectria estremocensis]|uniref:NAD-dependent epimerase/dehydratase domain-containing protein n=1 Tax=Dactylonectria estremocensis TaxID=1079267 RepID=A0A9P9JDX7_9HYPO|nr:hypothetical protein B0J13DRAFT_517226 [Dactylonectria estremocensis]